MRGYLPKARPDGAPAPMPKLPASACKPRAATYVYVVCFGERGGGHDPVTAWASLNDALGSAEREFSIRPTHAGGVQWKATINGVDEVIVQRLTIKGGAE